MAHLLVVDDDADIRSAIGMLLREEGYEVTEAASPNAALALLDDHVFALILSDLFAHSQGAPLESIAEFVARAYPTPVGVISGWPLMKDAVAVSRIAFFVRKPFDIDDLLTVIASTLHMTLTAEQERQAEQVRRYFEALSTRNWDALVTLCADDLLYVLPGGGLLSKTVRGRAAFRTCTEEMFRQFAAARFENLRIYATPQGLATRYESIWLGADQREQRQAGGVIFHFDGDAITMIGVQLNDARLRVLTAR